jgi:hypothetical protein
MNAADVSRGDWLCICWLLRDARALSVSILFLIVILIDPRQFLVRPDSDRRIEKRPALRPAEPRACRNPRQAVFGAKTRTRPRRPAPEQDGKIFNDAVADRPATTRSCLELPCTKKSMAA